ncbi:hypothetical protein ASE13_12975 [Sphingomonas sp. Root241]|nr:hypothetical protein ASE13_12975 [Sphingomonas sp. Root241]
MQAGLTRSDVLRSLMWPISALLLVLVTAITAKADNWIIVLISAPLAVFFTIYAASYVFCLFYDRDALRSEKYTLHKMAIEHGIYGDSAVGVIEPPKLAGPARQSETSEPSEKTE